MGRKKKKKRSAQKRAAELAAKAGEQVAELQPAPPSEAAPVAAVVAAAGAEAAPVVAATTPVPLPSVPEPAAVVPPPAAPQVPEAAPAHRSTEPEEPVEDLDIDLDDEDAAGSYESLVAEVASLRDEPRKGGAPTARKSDEVVSVEDIDEVIDLDDDGDAPGAVRRLIAQAGVGAPAEKEEVEEDVPLIDLDADDRTPKAPGTAHRAPGPAAPASTRLVEAAAAGAPSRRDAGVSLDLGEVSTPEARARLLAQALAHAEHQEARYRIPLIDPRRARRWKGVVASVLFVLAGAVAVAPPGWVRPDPPAQLNAAARERGTRLALLLQAQQVDAFRVRSDRLPDTLAELPISLRGVQYARSGNRSYQLMAYEPDGSVIVYDSTIPAAGFRMLMNALAPAEITP